MTGSSRPDPSRLAVKLTLLMVMSLTMLTFAPLSPSLPEIHTHFADVANIDYLSRFVLTVPAAFIAVTAPLAGIVIDRIGRKRLLLVSLLLYGTAGVSGILADTIGFLLATRAIQGIAVGGTMASATALMGDYYTGRERQAFIGLRGAFINYAGVFANIVGGLAAGFNWRATFLLYAVAFVLFPVVVRVIFEPDRSPSRTPVPADSRTNGAATPSRTPFGFLALAYGVTVLFSIGFFMVPVQMAFYLRELGNDVPAVAGIAMATSAFAVATSSLAFAHLRVRFGPEPLMGLAFLVAGVGFLMVSQAPSVPYLLAALLVSGSGFGVLIANVLGWVFDRTPAAIRGRVSGGIATSTFAGQFLTPLVSQPVVNAYSVGVAYAAVAGLLLLAAAGFAIFALSRRRRAAG